MNKHYKQHFFYDLKIDFHGYHVEDAIKELEELVYINERSSIMIIHGRGDGALRNGIRKFLNSSKYVKSIDLGENINIPGTDGVTIAYTL